MQNVQHLNKSKFEAIMVLS